MHDPSYDMRSHQASHYGPSHDEGKREFAAFKQPHDDMPVAVAGGGAGALSPGRLIHTSGARHADLHIALAQAMGLPLEHFGDVSGGPLSGV